MNFDHYSVDGTDVYATRNSHPLDMCDIAQPQQIVSVYLAAADLRNDSLLINICFSRPHTVS